MICRLKVRHRNLFAFDLLGPPRHVQPTHKSSPAGNPQSPKQQPNSPAADRWQIKRSSTASESHPRGYLLSLELAYALESEHNTSGIVGKDVPDRCINVAPCFMGDGNTLNATQIMPTTRLGEGYMLQVWLFICALLIF